jgi:hypothetical protein
MVGLYDLIFHKYKSKDLYSMILHLKMILVFAQFLFNHIKHFLLRYTNYYIENPMCIYVKLK